MDSKLELEMYNTLVNLLDEISNKDAEFDNEVDDDNKKKIGIELSEKIDKYRELKKDYITYQNICKKYIKDKNNNVSKDTLDKELETINKFRDELIKKYNFKLSNDKVDTDTNESQLKQDDSSQAQVQTNDSKIKTNTSTQEQTQNNKPKVESNNNTQTKKDNNDNKNEKEDNKKLKKGLKYRVKQITKGLDTTGKVVGFSIKTLLLLGLAVISLSSLAAGIGVVFSSASIISKIVSAGIYGASSYYSGKGAVNLGKIFTASKMDVDQLKQKIENEKDTKKGTKKK